MPAVIVSFPEVIVKFLLEAIVVSPFKETAPDEVEKLPVEPEASKLPLIWV